MLTVPEISTVFSEHGLRKLSQVMGYCNPAELSILRTAILIGCNIDIYNDELDDLLDEEVTARLTDFEANQDPLLAAIMLNEEDSTSGLVIRGISFTRIFGTLAFVFGAAYVMCITWIPIPPENIRFADMCSGFILGTVLSTIVNFFFGSSSLASANAKTIYRQASHLSNAVAQSAPASPAMNKK